MKHKNTESAAHALMTIHYAVHDATEALAGMETEAGRNHLAGQGAATAAGCLAWVDWAMTESNDSRNRIEDALVFTELIGAPSGTWRAFDMSDGRTKMSINSDGEIRFLPGASRRMVKGLEVLKDLAFGD